MTLAIDTLKDFDIDVCRTGFGFATIKVQAANEFEAGEKALDQAGDHSYNEKSSEYALSNPVPNPKEANRSLRLVLELDSFDGAESTIAGSEFVINAQSFARIKSVAKACKELELSESRYFAYPEWLHDDEESYESLDVPEIVVSTNGIHFQGIVRHTDTEMRSQHVDLSILEAAFAGDVDLLVVTSRYPASAIEFLDRVRFPVDDLDVGRRTIITTPGGEVDAAEFAEALEMRGDWDPQERGG